MRGNLNHPKEEQQQKNLDERRRRIQCPVDLGEEAWWKTKKMKKIAENNEEDEDESIKKICENCRE